MQPKHLPIDLLNKTFRRCWRGFDRAAVSVFLEEVASSMEEVVAENSSLSQRLSIVETELARYKAMESTLNEALILAQKTAREMHLNAQKGSDLILDEAQQQKERILRSAKEEIADREQQLDDLKRLKVRFLADLRGLLTTIWQLAQNGQPPHPMLPLPIMEEPAQPDEAEPIPLLSNSSW
jgi:cell division initiation protein